MGQKVNPIGLRVGINRTWDSRWFADKDYSDKLYEDLKLREHIFTSLKAAGISRVVIERIEHESDDLYSSPWCDHRP